MEEIAFSTPTTILYLPISKFLKALKNLCRTKFQSKIEDVKFTKSNANLKFRLNNLISLSALQLVLSRYMEIHLLSFSERVLKHLFS